MENKSKKIIMVMIIVLVVLALVIIGALILINRDVTLDEIEYLDSGPLSSELKRVNIRSDFYIVKNILEKYYTNLCNLNMTSEDIQIYEDDKSLGNIQKIVLSEIENNKNMIYSFFNNNCIQEIGLSIENIQEKLGNYKDLYILINDMYVREITESVSLYFVYGTITESDKSKTENFEFMVAVDVYNSTFDIYTSSYVKNHNLYELSKKEDFKEKYFNVENVENRKYNKFKYELVKDETYAKDLLNTFTQSVKYDNIDYSYDRLHEQYKTNRFKSISEYKEYIQNKKKDIVKAVLKSYKVNRYDDYKQYICMDYNGNYYIFNEKDIMDYTLILDTYTVEIPEFTEKYITASDQVKAGMNIENIFAAINNGDYKYVYSKLDNTFKKNQFPTENDLKNYIQNNFLATNNIEYLEFSQEGDICIYKTKINNREFNIVMQLGSETEFTMSFSFE